MMCKCKIKRKSDDGIRPMEWMFALRGGQDQESENQEGFPTGEHCVRVHEPTQQ